MVLTLQPPQLRRACARATDSAATSCSGAWPARSARRPARRRSWPASGRCRCQSVSRQGLRPRRPARHGIVQQAAEKAGQIKNAAHELLLCVARIRICAGPGRLDRAVSEESTARAILSRLREEYIQRARHLPGRQIGRITEIGRRKPFLSFRVFKYTCYVMQIDWSDRLSDRGLSAPGRASGGSIRANIPVAACRRPAFHIALCESFLADCTNRNRMRTAEVTVM